MSRPKRAHPPGLIGESRAIRRVRREIEKLAPTTLPVLLTGETGTGKELAARMLHARSPRADGPFVVVNCAAIPDNLLESELFGHEKGAFTGAYGRHYGHFEQADGGVLFLDEIGDLSPFHQAKLLRALEEKVIRRVGGSEGIPLDFRLIVATNRDLHGAMLDGSFRPDLYFRVAGGELTLPPLRERDGDSGLLTRYFAAQEGNGIRISPGFMAVLGDYAWPGNVRELKMVVTRAVQIAPQGVLDPALLPERLVAGEPLLPAGDIPFPARFPTLEQVEREHIRRALDRAHGNQSEAARILGVHRNLLIRRLKKYGSST